MSSAWFTLFLAGLLEVCWATGLKYTEGFTRLIPTWGLSSTRPLGEHSVSLGELQSVFALR